MRQEQAGLEEAIKLQAQLDEEVAKQIHLDKWIAKRMAEEEALSEQQKKRKAQNQGTWKLSQLKKLKFEEIKEEFDKLVQQIDTFVPINLKATKTKLKRYGEKLQTKMSKKQRIDDKDVLAIGEKVAEVKEEEPVKRTGKRKKQKARKGINVNKSAQEDSETDKEESVEAMNPTHLTTKSVSKMTLRAQETCMIWLEHIGGLEGDEEGLVDVLVKLETSFDEVFTTFDAAASTRRNKKIMCNFKLYKVKIFEERISIGCTLYTKEEFQGNYMPPGPDREVDDSMFTYGPKQSKTSETDTQTNNFDSCESNYNVETLESVSESVVVEPKVEKPSFAFVNTVKHVKTPRETVKEQNTYSPSPKADKRDWNGLISKRLGLGYGFTKKACFVCGSFSHLIRDCDFHEKRMSKQVELNKKKGKGTCQWENRPDDPQKTLKNKGIVDSRCSRHMTSNKAYLAEYQDYNGGPIAFGNSCVSFYHHTTNGHQFTMSYRHHELASPEQTDSGKDFSNPLIVDSLLKTIWFINAPCYFNEALAIPGQTAAGKELSNPLMADSLPKTILPPKLLE
ncbi:hypothetical protein Tco_1394809 [Tanacetum coccineum]